MPEAPATADLQGWMQGAILAGTTREARERIRGDARLSADARLSIYTQAYRLRLLQCLRDEYPLLAALAGPTAFDLFARGYIGAHPPRAFTLYAFGADFAGYLEATRPAGDGTPQTVEAIPAALARIERARMEVAHAHGIERLGPPAPGAPVIAAILGLRAGRCREAAWRRPDSVRLLALPFDFTATLAAAPETCPPPPAPVPSLLAVARAGYRVACHRLEPWQYDWLARLPPLGEDPAGVAPEIDAAGLSAWLPFAERSGLAVAA